MSKRTDQQVSAEERQRRLNDASRRYMRGNLTVEEFEKVERENMPDYVKAAIAIARGRSGASSNKPQAFRIRGSADRIARSAPHSKQPA